MCVEIEHKIEVINSHYLSKVLGKGLADKIRYIGWKSREKKLELPGASD